MIPSPDSLPVIFGASGYLGRALLTDLSRHGPVLAVARSFVEQARLANVYFLDFQDGVVSPPVDAAICNRKKVAFHFCGASRESAYRSIRASNVETTRAILSWCRRFNTTRIIYMSGFGVSCETSSVYYRAKAEAEQLIIDSGLEYAILRASYIVGNGDELTPWLLSGAKGGRISIPGDGTYRIQPLWIDDVVAVYRQLLQDNRSIYGVYDLLGDEVGFLNFCQRIVWERGLYPAFVSRPIEEYIRDSLFSKAARFSLTELAILLADAVGQRTTTSFGVRLEGLDAIVKRLSVY